MGKEFTRKTKILVIDSDLNARTRMKSLLGMVVDPKGLGFANSTRAALAKLETGGSWNCVFLASDIGEGNIHEFIDKALMLPAAMNCYFMLIVKSQHQDSTFVAAQFVKGVNGFLFEPYSVDGLTELLDSAVNSQALSDENRARSSISFLVKDVIHSIDRVAYNEALGRSSAIPMKDFRVTSNTLAELGANDLDEYFSILLQRFGSTGPPAEILGRKNTRSEAEQVDSQESSDSAGSSKQYMDLVRSKDTRRQ